MTSREQHTRPVLTAVPVLTTQISLSWSAVEEEMPRYEVEWKPGKKHPWRAVDPAYEGTDLLYSHTEVTPGDRTSYRVRAVDAEGKIGEWSDEVSVTTPHDKRRLSKKALLIEGSVIALAAVAALVAVAFLLLHGSKNPNDVAMTYINGNIGQMGDQVAECLSLERAGS